MSIVLTNTYCNCIVDDNPDTAYPSSCDPPSAGASKNGVSTAVSIGSANVSSVVVTPSLEDLTNSMQQSNLPVDKAIAGKGAANTGAQITSLQDANQISQLGASHAATVGAVFCAQGANAQLASSPDTAGFYAQCKQNFDAAYGLSGHAGNFTADNAALQGSAAQSVFSQFEENFGISQSDYLSSMLSASGGRGALPDLISSKLKGEQLAREFERADELGPGNLTKKADAQAVNFGSPRAKTTPTIESLRSKLAKAIADSRNPASTEGEGGEAQDKNEFKGLDPLSTAFAPGAGADNEPELTFFDVVHRKYAELARRVK